MRFKNNGKKVRQFDNGVLCGFAGIKYRFIKIYSNYVYKYWAPNFLNLQDFIFKNLEFYLLIKMSN
jgi:hypothetical protein